jgi:hypothetical protein
MSRYTFSQSASWIPGIYGVLEPATTCCRSNIRITGHGHHILGEQEGQAMRREDSLAQLPSEIIHISLQQPSSPAPAAPSGTSIKAKVLNPSQPC